MQEEQVAYFGRLIMEQPPAADGTIEFLTAVRYGSIDDARRGTAIARELLHDNMQKWFSHQVTLIGTATRVLEL